MKDADKPMRWRRATRGEAVDFFFILFTLAMLLGVPWNMLVRGEADIERAFHFAILFAPGLAVVSLLVRLKADFGDRPAPPEEPPAP